MLYIIIYQKSARIIIVSSETGAANTLTWKPLAFDVPEQIINNRTLVLLRFVGESLGAVVDYDPATYVITVDMPAEDTPEDTIVAPSGPEKLLVNVMSFMGVSNNPPNKTQFTLTDTATITKIATYHWNDGQGSTPGTIGLKNVSTGELIGSWDASASANGYDFTPGMEWSMANVPPYTWWATLPNVTIPAGTYEVVDSDPATWSYTSETNNQGFCMILGISDGTAGATAP